MSLHWESHSMDNNTLVTLETAVVNNSIDKIEEIWEYDEKMKKRELVINTIVQRSAFSSHQILQGINEAASPSSATGSSKVEAIVLSGGYTNYSYKIFVPGQPHLCLFAKLTFERAIWNPDKDALYDLQRTVNEYELMATFSKIMPDCVVAPLALWDVEHEGQKMKLLVTEWSKADEQFSNQLIDGSIDPRAAPKLASALAAISSMTDYDPHFNEQAKSYMDTQAAKHLRSSIEHLCLKCKPKDRTENYCSMMGAEIVLKVIDANYVDFHRSDCLVHSDSHAFNILVEAKPNEQDLDLFAPDGTVVLCDFEMASVGPFGRDAGLVLSWPLACMVSHALKNTESNANIQIRRFIETFLTCYLSEMSTGRTAKEMAYMYRRCYGWAGLFMVAVFYLKVAL